MSFRSSAVLLLVVACSSPAPRQPTLVQSCPEQQPDDAVHDRATCRRESDGVAQTCFVGPGAAHYTLTIPIRATRTSTLVLDVRSLAPGSRIVFEPSDPRVEVSRSPWDDRGEVWHLRWDGELIPAFFATLQAGDRALHLQIVPATETNPFVLVTTVVDEDAPTAFRTPRE